MYAENPARRRGFTLVELMVVIALIALLVSILLPALGAVRKQAKVVQTRGTFNALTTGLESYKAEGKVGGDYPPSFSDGTGGNYGKVKSPFDNSMINIAGAGTLVWALAGADLIGTPGFTPRGSFSTWSAMSGKQYNVSPVTPSDLYAMDPNNMPAYPRFGPYVTLDKMSLTVNKGGSGAASFPIPNDMNANATRKYPMFLDTFGQPILYWRADLAGNLMADPNHAAGMSRGIYHWDDNSDLLVGANALDFGGGTNGGHQLDWYTGTFDPNLPATPTDNFQGFICDTHVQAKLTPKQPREYILLSAGPDGRYGTGDDIANIEVGNR